MFETFLETVPIKVLFLSSCRCIIISWTSSPRTLRKVGEFSQGPVFIEPSFCRRRVALSSFFSTKRFLFIAKSGHLLVSLFQYEWHLRLPRASSLSNCEPFSVLMLWRYDTWSSRIALSYFSFYALLLHPPHARALC